MLAERNPERFVPRYSMVTFTRMPYATAFARGAAQDRLLRELTAGRQRIGEIDLAAADAKVRERARTARIVSASADDSAARIRALLTLYRESRYDVVPAARRCRDDPHR